MNVRQLYHTPRARADLLDLWVYVGAENPNAADAILDSISRRLNQLTRHPYSGMLREDIGPGVRHLVAGQYLAFYRITPDYVEILRVLHGKRRATDDMVG